jgi:hypothetical protein
LAFADHALRAFTTAFAAFVRNLVNGVADEADLLAALVDTGSSMAKKPVLPVSRGCGDSGKARTSRHN